MKSSKMNGLILGLALLAGCGGSEPYKHEIENPDPPEVVYVKDILQYLEDMKNQNNGEGPGSIDFLGFEEGMAGYEDPPVGENQDVVDEIMAGVSEVKELAAAGKKQEVGEKLDTLIKKIQVLIPAGSQ